MTVSWLFKVRACHLPQQGSGLWGTGFSVQACQGYGNNNNNNNNNNMSSGNSNNNNNNSKEGCK